MAVDADAQAPVVVIAMPGVWQWSWMKGTTSSATYASYIACTYERWRGWAPVLYQLSLFTEPTQKSLTFPSST